ncbi:hypothetical protein C8C85_3025 [Flavobacterium sp. 103]|uniref:hypothetical protein n=1 Tax=unclassified Flavobacterium TaxID=196869 RepID=UPI000D5CBE18|nr:MULTISPECIES: hypothetical protein [unclassified Flavobacterium]PVX47109.1 hypothetical protein C8C85_3025 [Flavobacterium sp. 103]QKJ64352.1 hypothetical protein HQN62_14845 [Flavobacterium sp. M31R6]
MKKIIAIAVLFISSVGFSQIKVVETVPVEKLGRVNNSFYVQKIGDEFTFFYTTVQSEDEESALKAFTFKNVDNAYQSLYGIISKGFTASPLNDVKLELPNNFVWLHYIVSSDKTTVQFMVSNKEASATHISEPLSKEQVEKLFQKS